MDLTIQQLRMLREVSVTGTIGAAAKSLGYTASAVSQQLGGLERAAGVAVLEKVGRNVQLTDAGRELVFHAGIVLAQIEEASAALERVSTEASGVLRVGVMESIAMSMLPRILTLLAERYPKIEIRTRESDPTDPYEQMRAGSLDAAFTVDYPNAPGPTDPNIVRHIVFLDWFKAVVPVGHHLDGDTVDLGRFSGESMIAGPVAVVYSRCVLQACRTAGFEPNVVHEIDDYPSTLGLVAAGAGVSLVPELALLDPPDGVRVMNLAVPVCRSVEVAHRASSSDRPALQALLAVVDEVADEFGLDRGVPA